MKPTIDLKAPNHNLHASVLCPIAAIDIEAIQNHVGNFKYIEGTNEQALLVDWKPYDNNLNPKLNHYGLKVHRFGLAD